MKFFSIANDVFCMVDDAHIVGLYHPSVPHSII